MLDMITDEKLKQMGMSREIVNKVQKLRKAAGLHIDDHVEIFYDAPSNEESVFHQVLTKHLELIKSSVKIPFL